MINIKINNGKVIYKLYLFSIIMLTNGLLFNFLFSFLSIRPWRQIIWILGFLLFISVFYKNQHFFVKSKLYIHLRWSFLILFFASLSTIFFNNYNITRIIFGWVSYLFGYGFIILPFIIIKLRKESSFFAFMAWLGLIVSIGLILDGLNFISLTAFKSIYSTTPELKRSSFLSEASTIIGISRVLLLICTFYSAYLAKSKKKKIFYLLTSLIIVLGGYFTGSRQVFFVLLFTEVVAMYSLSKYNYGSKLSNYLLIMLVIIFGYFLIEPIISNSNYDKFIERFLEDTDGGNRVRLDAFDLGLRQLSWVNLQYWFTGHGLTYTSGQFALPGESVGYHMESSVWARFSECGIFSIYVFFWPWFYSVILWMKLKKSYLKILIFCFLLSYIFTAFVSPNASHYLSSMSLFIVLGLLILLNNTKSNLLKRLRINSN